MRDETLGRLPTNRRGKEPQDTSLAPGPSGGASPTPAAPARIAQYAITGELGRGGMGVVYRAFDTSLRRPVAIKMLLDREALGPVSLERFRREATLIARLRHPGIVQVFETGEHEGRPFIVLELVEGESLELVLERGPLAPRHAAEIVHGVALALAHAHEHGLVHRDVKPANVLVDRQGTPRLMDFGIARDTTVTGELTRTGDMLGTPYYMAPEQMLGTSNTQGPLTDVYALGALLYRAIAGAAPFTAPTIQALIYKVVHEEPAAPRALRPEIPRDLETIALACLAKEPARRLAGAAELAEELARFLDGKPIHAQPPGWPERAWRRVRRRPLAILLAAFALSALALVLVLHNREQKLAAALEQRRHEEEERRAVLEKARALARQAHELARAGKLDGAIDAASRAIAIAPRLAEAWSIRALARWHKREIDLAVEDATVAIQCDPTLAEGWAARALGRYLKRDLANALDDANAALRLDEKSPAAWTARAAARVGLGETDGALEDADKAIELDPESALAWTTRSNALGTKGDLDGAIAAASKAIALDATFAMAWRTRAASRTMKSDYAGGIDDASKAIELEPRLASSWAYRARARIGLGQVDLAIEDATTALALDTLQSEAWYARSLARGIKGQFDLAIDDANHAIDLAPKQAQSWVARAMARSYMGDLDGCLADANEALAITPKHGDALLVRAHVRKVKGDLDGSLEDVTNAIALDPPTAVPFQLRAEVRLAKGDLEGALADGIAGTERSPRSPTTRARRSPRRRGRSSSIRGIPRRCTRAPKPGTSSTTSTGRSPTRRRRSSSPRTSRSRGRSAARHAPPRATARARSRTTAASSSWLRTTPRRPRSGRRSRRCEGADVELVGDRFALERRLGPGAPGEVWLARDRDGSPVVLKLLHERLAGSPRHLERFRREMLALEKLSHPHVVVLRDSGVCAARGRPYYVMEWIPGRPLDEVVHAEAPLPVPRSLRIADQVLDALASAHAQVGSPGTELEFAL